QNAQTPVAISRLLFRYFDQVSPQFLVRLGSRLVPIRAPIHLHQLAGVALTQAMLLNHQRHCAALPYKLQPFFRITVCRASLSKLGSPPSFFTRLFSFPRPPSRRASLPSIPPYFDFQAYSVASVTPSSRAISRTLRPASISFTARITCSSVYRLFFISIAPFVSNYRSFQVLAGRVFGGQVSASKN